MAAYEWTCQVCDARNEVGETQCSACKAPSEISAWDMHRLKNKDATLTGFMWGELQPKFARDYGILAIVFLLIYGGFHVIRRFELEFLKPLFFFVFAAYFVFFWLVWWKSLKLLLKKYRGANDT